MATAHQTCVYTAFSLVPSNCWCRSCFIHLNNISTCQQLLYSVQIGSAGRTVLLVRKTRISPDAASLNRMRPQMLGDFLAE